MSNRLSKQKLVPISEAAIVLGVSIDTVRRWDKSGILHSERPDGKNRYFSLEELKQHKLNQPLSISEVAGKFGVSATTLRRLEARGLIKPKRNNAGERVYDEDLLKNFLNSDYFLRKKQIKEKFPEPFQNETEDLEGGEPEIPNIRPTPTEAGSRMPQFWATSILSFVLLVSFSIWNINISKATTLKPQPTPAVLSETTESKEATSSAMPDITYGAVVEATPSATTVLSPVVATAEAKPETTLRVKINDGSTFVNIRQKPSLNSEKTGQADDGDTFKYISLNAGWYEIILADGSKGFISAKYAIKEED